MKDFKQKNILIIGDIMLDKYIYGNINRISPEAPVPVLEMKQKYHKPGGAANVAMNIKSLGSNPVLFSILGDDRDGNVLLKILKQNGIDTKNVLRDNKKATTVKTRIMANGQHVLRIDEENIKPVDKKMNELLIYVFDNIIEENEIDGVIIQDYDKGLLNEDFIKIIIQKLNKSNIPIAVDPKFNNFFIYKNVDIFKPNIKEVSIALNKQIEPTVNILHETGQELFEYLDYKNLFITLGEKGIYYSDGEKSEIHPTKKIDVVDVSGAGDVVISILMLGLLNNMDIKEIIKLANIAGGLACEKMGVTNITKNRLFGEKG
ncbi:MAG TPA: hypothetical protein ENK91_10645 [Bacteroidetes bacterium]|nr:hypothetical protein [Bacteroidota bacterium]